MAIAGKKRVFATATGTIFGYITNQASRFIPMRISAMVVPDRRCNLFSSAESMKSEISPILETEQPHLKFYSNGSLELSQHPEDRGL